MLYNYVFIFQVNIEYYFGDNEHLENVIERSNIEKSILTAWFYANTIYPDARNSTYADFPIRWVYNNQTKNWKPRQ